MTNFEPSIVIDTILSGEPTSVGVTNSSILRSTSLSLARALAIGSVAGWRPSGDHVEVWDPTIGEGGAASLLADALHAAGFTVAVRGQDIDPLAVEISRQRLARHPQSDVEVGDTLIASTPPSAASADLVIVDPPWGLDWRELADPIRARHERGEFQLGLPTRSDATWLFIALALERLKRPDDGGGRVAALVHKRLLSSSAQADDSVRKRLLASGVLESVVRLPEALAPHTAIPLYLMTFTNVRGRRRAGHAQVMDLRTGFRHVKEARSMTREALAEIGHNLNVWKPSQRSRILPYETFTRRSATVARRFDDGAAVDWNVTTYENREITSEYLDSRYSEPAGVRLVGEVRVSTDLDPGHVFADDLRELEQDLKAKSWPRGRLTSVMRSAARAVTAGEQPGQSDSAIWVPTFRGGLASTQPPDLEGRQRAIEIAIDRDLVTPEFMAAWLNSDVGQQSRARALSAAATSTFAHGVPSNERALMRWADELIVPIPQLSTQSALARADEQLRSIAADISRRRQVIWTDPDSADAVTNLVARSFDDSVERWLEELPYPVATAVWTALTATTAGDKQRSLIHAWEAIAAFHATLLLSGSRTDTERSDELERSIGRALRARNIGITRASFGTWVVIVEKLASEIRKTIGNGDEDELARLRRAFANLPTATIARLVSKDLVALLNEINLKRNRWLGHSGHVSETEYEAQAESLLADLQDLRSLLADAWSQAPLVRAAQLRRRSGTFYQTVEIVMGTRAPFQRRELIVGEPMDEGQLYIAKDEVETPLRLSRLVHLAAAPSGAQFTSYFYNRTEPDGVHLVSYQHGSDVEIHEALEAFRSEFGSLDEDIE